MPDLVETYSGHRLHETPLRFQLQGTWHTVVRILARWQEPESLCFTVLAEDGRNYSLEYIQANPEVPFSEIEIPNQLRSISSMCLH